MPFTDKYLGTFSLGKKVKISRVCKLQKMVPQKYRVVGDYNLEYYQSSVHQGTRGLVGRSPGLLLHY